jgi:hypothetical protein
MVARSNEGEGGMGGMYLEKYLARWDFGWDFGWQSGGRDSEKELLPNYYKLPRGQKTAESTTPLHQFYWRCECERGAALHEAGLWPNAGREIDRDRFFEGNVLI